MRKLNVKELNSINGGWVNFAVGGIIGGASYAGLSYYNNTPMSWRGAAVAIGSGALTGGIGSSLIRSAGGGLGANLAWRPNMFAANYSLNSIGNFR